MSELFILQNHEQLFLSKQNTWVDGRDLNQLYKSPYKDEAINQMVEVSAKDYHQRIKVLSCRSNDRGLPELDPDWLPEPLPKVVKDLFTVDALPVDDEALAPTDEEPSGTADDTPSAEHQEPAADRQAAD